MKVLLSFHNVPCKIYFIINIMCLAKFPATCMENLNLCLGLRNWSSGWENTSCGPGSVSTFAGLLIATCCLPLQMTSSGILHLCPTCDKPNLNLALVPSFPARAIRTLWTRQLCSQLQLNIYFSSLPYKQDKTIPFMLEKVAKVLPGHSYGHGDDHYLVSLGIIFSALLTLLFIA